MLLMKFYKNCSGSESQRPFAGRVKVMLQVFTTAVTPGEESFQGVGSRLFRLALNYGLCVWILCGAEQNTHSLTSFCWPLAFPSCYRGFQSRLQSVAGYLGLALVFVWSSAFSCEVAQLVRQVVYIMFISTNRPSFHLW